jgi:hypothetical protein
MLKLIFGLLGIGSPMLQGLIVGGVILGGAALVVGYIDHQATVRAEAKCNAAAVQGQLEAAQRDLRIEKEQREKAEKKAKELTDVVGARDKEISEYAEKNAKAGDCPVGDAERALDARLRKRQQRAR